MLLILAPVSVSTVTGRLGGRCRHLLALATGGFAGQQEVVHKAWEGNCQRGAPDPPGMSGTFSQLKATLLHAMQRDANEQH